MKLLVVGGPASHGVSEQERFDVRLTHYLSNRMALPAVLHLGVPGTLADAVFALRQPFVRLDGYDLIVLQTSDFAPNAFDSATNPSLRRRVAAFFRELTSFRKQQTQLRHALTLLEPHRSRVVVLTPPPGGEVLTTLLRRWQSARIELLCRLWAFRVVNQCQPDLRYEFLFDEISHGLNRLGHHYLSLEIIGALRLPSPKDDEEPAWL
jgi:hypothetical protein